MDVYILGLVVYLLVLLFFGLKGLKHTNTMDDYAVMGRNAKPWLMTATISTSWWGAGTISGLPAGVFSGGIATAMGWLIGTTLGFMVLIKIAPMINRTKMTTISDILEARYGVSARILGAIGVLGTWATYIGFQIIAIGWVLDVGLGIPPAPWGFTLGFGIVLLYTVLGGLYAVVWTDFIQAIFIVIGLLVAVPIAISNIGGFGVATNEILTISSDHLQPFGGGFFTFLGWALSLGAIAIVDPMTAQRLFALKSPKASRQVAYSAIFSPMFFYSTIPLLALFAFLIFPDIPNAEYSLLWIAKYLLPAIIGVPLLIAVIAVVMSTADAALNLCSVIIVNDFYKRFINPQASEKKLVLMLRTFVVLWAIFGLVMAFVLPSVLAGLTIAYTIIGGVVMPSYLAAFIWKRATSQGATVSMTLGIIMVIYWGIWPPIDIASIIPTMLVSAVSLIVVSLLTEPPSETKLKLFHGDTKKNKEVAL